MDVPQGEGGGGKILKTNKRDSLFIKEMRVL